MKAKRIRRCNIEWSKEMIFTLISLVKERQVLWNSHNVQDYADKKPKSAAWREIEEILQVDVDEPMVKWNSMRTSYRKTIFKQIKNPDAIRRQSKGQYISAMNFLLPVLVTDPTDLQSDMIFPSEHVVSEISDDATSFFDESTFDPIVCKNEIETSSEDLTQSISSPIPSKSSPKRCDQGATEDSKKDVIIDMAMEAFKRRNDEFDDVGNFVASNMRQWQNQANIVDKFREDLYALIYKSQMDYNRQRTN